MQNDTIEIFGARTGNCMRVAVALEEAGIAYTARPLDLRAGEQRSSEHLARNPAGKVPTLVERRRGAEPFILNQSNAIMLHVADRAPGTLMPEAGTTAHAIALERFLLLVTDVIVPNGVAFGVRHREPEAAKLIYGAAAEVLRSASRFVEETPFMAGDRFTLADVAGITIATAMEDEVAWDELPALRDWRDRVAARPAVQRGMKAFG